jgi:hypothetical protein
MPGIVKPLLVIGFRYRQPITDVIRIVAAAFADSIGTGGIEVVAVRVVNAGATVNEIMSPRVTQEFERIDIRSLPEFWRDVRWTSDKSL